MRVKLKLINQGKKNNPYWWIIAQPIKKKLQGRHLEHLGIWATQKKATVPRQISINQHRVRYWLSVGAIPTPKVQKLLQKFDFVPPTPKPFGSQHSYVKPERVYKLQHFRGLGKTLSNDNKIDFYYRQKLQEQMNIVERKRRMTAEAMSSAHAATTPYENESDGMESEEVDVFQRKKRFDLLLEKFQSARKQSGLTLKGNDLQTNVWLKKMEKLARGDLGLDLAGYKDYVNNLKEFANANSDLAVFARDGFLDDNYEGSKMFLQMQIQNQADSFKNTNLQGLERVQRHSDSVMIALSKMLRQASGHLNKRDDAAIEDLLNNFYLYLISNPTILDQINRLYKRRQAEIEQEISQQELLKELNDVPMSVLEQAGVSLRQLEQIRVLLAVDKNIFTQKIHEPNYAAANIHDAFVDFTKLPENIPKEAKSLLYRPDKIKTLCQAYKKISMQMSSNYQKKKEAEQSILKNKHRKLQYQSRFPQKTKKELEYANKIHEAVGKFVTSSELKLDPKLEIDVSNNKTWNESLLQRLIRERRMIPKEERLKRFRNDSVDEVDTTDLENWDLKFRGKVRIEEESEPDEDELEFKFLFDTETEKIDYNDDKYIDRENERIMLRHRLDMARLFLGKDGGYSLRKFKRIFKREMQENPDKYQIGKAVQTETQVKSTSSSEGTSSSDGDEKSEKEEQEEQEDEEQVVKAESGEDNAAKQEVDVEEQKQKLRAQVKKEIDEMNKDSEEEHYEFEEEELEKLLQYVEETEIYTEEDAQKFLEKKHAELQAMRYRPTRQPKKDRTKLDVYDDFLKETPEVESKYANEWILDKQSLDDFFDQIQEKIGRYPRGFRHYESFANYKLLNPDADIKQYTQEMNRQVEFDEFCSIMRQAAIEESMDPEFKFDNEFGEEELSIQEMLQLPVFEQECRIKYNEKVQEALLERKWFTLVDALDDTLDMFAYGRNMFDFSMINTYIPVKHTIMPKPSLLENDELGFRYNLDDQKSKLQVKINPVAQINPLKGFRMSGGFDKVLDPRLTQGMKFNKFRRLSHVKRQ